MKRRSHGGYPLYPASNHYDPIRRRFFNPEPKRRLQPLDFGGAFKMLSRKGRFPAQPLPFAKPDFAAFMRQEGLPENEQKARFVWFGHSTLLMRVAGLNILTDPVFGMSAAPNNKMFRRFQPPPAAPHELPPLDIILYSHNHYDHLEESFVRSVADSGVHFLVPLGMEVLLRRWGVKAENISAADWYQSHTVGGVTFTATPARLRDRKSVV